MRIPGRQVGDTTPAHIAHRGLMRAEPTPYLAARYGQYWHDLNRITGEDRKVGMVLKHPGRNFL